MREIIKVVFASLFIFLSVQTFAQTPVGTPSTTTSTSGAKQLIEQAKAAGISGDVINQVKQQGLTPEQRAQAKMAGYSDAQINAGLNQLRETSQQTTTTDIEQVDRNEDATSDDDKDQQHIRINLGKGGNVFGREIFNTRNLTFAPNFNIPTPPNYKLAAGDEVIISIWGSSEANINQKISPEGKVTIPMAGPVMLAGLTISEAQARLKSHLSKIYSGLNGGGTHLSLTLGKIRSIKVNIVGEVLVPGTYTLPSLASLFNALYLAGGVNRIGSLRTIKVYRNSKEVGTLDVYDYLLNGKFESNIRLEDNDMIIVSPYEKLVTIAGKVKRPRTFEMKKSETLQDLIRFAGGFMGDAYNGNLQVKRKGGKQYQMFNVEEAEYKDFVMGDGDNVNVGEILNMFANRLIISGAVYRPGEYALTDKVNSVKSLVERADGIMGDAMLTRAQINRLTLDMSTEIVPVDLKGILDGSKADITLQPEDILYIPSIYDLTDNYFFRIKGEVARPGKYMYKKGMTIEDLVIEAGGLKHDAALIKAEVARRIRNPHATSVGNIIAKNYFFNIDENFQLSDSAKRFVLEPYDEVTIRRSPGYEEQQSVKLTGEVQFGGEYVLTHKNQRLSELVKMAGGVTPTAYIRGARLTRKLTDDESARIKTLLKLANKTTGKDSIDRSKLDIGTDYFVGINMEEALNNPGSDADIVLREGDVINVPQYNNTVRISGSVLYPNAVTYSKKMSYSDYISQAGGFDSNAKKRKSFVIYMNGTVARKTAFRSPKIEPGCEIVVPTKPEKRGISTAEVLGFTTSTISMAAVVTSLLNAIK